MTASTKVTVNFSASDRSTQQLLGELGYDKQQIKSGNLEVDLNSPLALMAALNVPDGGKPANGKSYTLAENSKRLSPEEAKVFNKALKNGELKDFLLKKIPELAQNPDPCLSEVGLLQTLVANAAEIGDQVGARKIRTIFWGGSCNYSKVLPQVGDVKYLKQTLFNPFVEEIDFHKSTGVLGTPWDPKNPNSTRMKFGASAILIEGASNYYMLTAAHVVLEIDPKIKEAKGCSGRAPGSKQDCRLRFKNAGPEGKDAVKLGLTLYLPNKDPQKNVKLDLPTEAVTLDNDFDLAMVGPIDKKTYGEILKNAEFYPVASRAPAIGDPILILGYFLNQSMALHLLPGQRASLPRNEGEGIILSTTINHGGTSGGAATNAAGELVGIISAKTIDGTITIDLSDPKISPKIKAAIEDARTFSAIKKIPSRVEKAAQNGAIAANYAASLGPTAALAAGLGTAIVSFAVLE